MAVRYEWDVETLDAAPSEANGFDPDILEHYHCETYAEALSMAAHYSAEGWPNRIVLVRDVGNDLDGLTDRAWAYMKDGKLPETFSYAGASNYEDSGIAVPKRFHREAERATERTDA
jgi:hypothetical protein